ncbi:hypothetical protein AB1Y20_013164 [Prymnesium parvum]|uniref:SSD domain-containing protein n=1 Tax=Prymnesium parvum TaxID=97485 RepID=A0AB34IMS6_PRYPA
MGFVIGSMWPSLLLAAAAAAPPLEPRPGVRNVVFTLVKGGYTHQDFDTFEERNRCLRRSLAPHTTFDSVAFHDGSIEPSLLRAQQRRFPEVRFVSAVDHAGFGGVGAAHADSRKNYRFMCEFMSLLWHRALRRYEYAMRIDEDVCMQDLGSWEGEPQAYKPRDPFEMMRERGRVYAFGVETEERHEETLSTFNPWLRTHAPLHAKSDVEVDVNTIFFTNVFISNISWWARPEVQSFLEDVQKSNGIFEHRWGDAPIQTAALKLLAEKDTVAKLQSSYLHLSLANAFRDGVEVPFETLHPIALAFWHRVLSETSSSNCSSNSSAANGSSCEAVDGKSYKVLVTFIASMTLDEVTPNTTAAIQSLFAARASVNDSAVQVAVEAASVSFHVEVNLPSEVEMLLMQIAFDEEFANASSTERFLDGATCAAAPPSGNCLSTPLSVAQAPRVSALVSTPPAAPPPSPTAPPPVAPPAIPPFPLLPPYVTETRLESSYIMAATACAIFGCALLAIVATLALRKVEGRDVVQAACSATLVRKEILHEGLHVWSIIIVQHRLVVSVVVFAFFLASSLLLPFHYHLETGTQSEWAPSNGQFARNLKVAEQYLDESVTSRPDCFFLMKATDGSNLLDNPKHYLENLEKAMRQIRANAHISYTDSEGTLIDVRWDTVCLKLEHQLVNHLLALLGGARIPCANPSPLDAFYESTWHFEDQVADGSFQTVSRIGALAEQAGTTNQFFDSTSLPSYKNLTDEEIIRRLSDKPQHWLIGASKSLGELYGNMNYDVESGLLQFAETFNLQLFLDVPAEMVKYRPIFKNTTAEQLKEVSELFLLELSRQAQIIDEDEINYPELSLSFYPSNGPERMYAEIAAAQSTIFAVGYSIMFIFAVVIHAARSLRENLMLPAAVGYFLIVLSNVSAYGLLSVAVDFNHTMIQALPFLALGLGMDDLFIILSHFRDALSSMPDGEVTKANDRTLKVMSSTMVHAGSAVAITSACNACVFFLGCIIPIPALQHFMLGAGLIVTLNYLCAMTLIPVGVSLWCDFVLQRTTHVPAADRTWSLDDLSGAIYRVVAFSMPLKLCGVAIGVALLVTALALFPSVEYGYEVTDLARRGSYLEKGIHDAHTKMFSQHQVSTVIFGPEMDYPNDQTAMISTVRELKDSKWSASGALSRGTLTTDSWLELFLQVEDLCVNRTGLEQTIVCAPEDFYRDFNIWRRPAVYVPIQNDPYYIPGSAATTGFAFGSLTANVAKLSTSFAFKYGNDNYFNNNTMLLSFEVVELNAALIKSTTEKIQMVKDWKTICGASGKDIFMYGWLFTQIEQFLELDFYFWTAVALSASAIFIVSVLVGVSWAGAFIICLFALLILIEIYGFLYVTSLKYQSLVAVSMLSSLGISVEFIVHPIAAFEFAEGSRNERLAEAMRRTAVPVLWGGISSFLGVIMMAFSEFQYVVKYFFIIYVLIIGFGLLNGLVVLPCVLGIVGPCSSITVAQVQKSDSNGESKQSGTRELDVSSL